MAEHIQAEDYETIIGRVINDCHERIKVTSL